MPKAPKAPKVVKQQFFKTAGGSSVDTGRSITITENQVYLTGNVSGETGVDFNGCPIKTKLQGNKDIFVAGLDHCGKQKFFVTAGGPEGGAFADQGNQVSATKKCVFVVGTILGLTAIDFNGCPVNGLQGGQDIFVAGLDSCGKQKFFVTAGSTENDFGNAIVANEKRVFVTGQINGITGRNFHGGEIPTHPGSGDIFVAGLDHCGVQKFFVTAGGASADSGVAIALSEKKIFVTGFVSGDTAQDFDVPPKGYSLQGSHDIFVAGLDHCGKQKFFVTAGGAMSDQGVSIVATEDRVYVTGFLSGETAKDFAGGDVTGLQGELDIFVAGLDHCGNQKFFVHAGGSGFDQGMSIDVFNKEVYVTGYIGGTAATNFKGKPITTLMGDQDIFVAKLDDKGCQKFFKTAGGPDRDQAAKLVVIEERVYLTGVVNGLAVYDFEQKPVKNLQGNNDIFVASLDHSGHQKYFVTAGGQLNDGANLDAVDNKVFVTGIIRGTTGVDFKGCQIKNLRGSGDIFVARLDEDIPPPLLFSKMQYM